MPRGRFFFFLALVMAAAGASIWAVFLAVRAEALEGKALQVPALVALLTGIALRALRKDNGR